MIKHALIVITCSIFCTGAQASPSDAIKLLIGEKEYSCVPCGHHSGYVDDLYHDDGVCPICQMKLIAKPNFSALDQPILKPGSGNFVMTAGAASSDKTIVVFYHRPKKLNQDTRVLFVVPGSGRNAWDYRDAWKQASERYNVLVLSPAYSEEEFDFAAYHMGGVVEHFRFTDLKAAQAGRETSRYHLKDEDIQFDINIDKASWLFNDFDRIFDVVNSATDIQQTHYDMFGHSAGGQLLHRMVLFHPNTKANKIIASNSGLYTLPNWDLPPLFGLKGVGIEKDSLKVSLSKNLIVLIGELDNEDEQGGTLLHTPIADQQGLGRLSRGRSFYATAEDAAKALNVELNWQLQIAKGVGHDHQKMSKAAAKVLYAKSAE